MGIIAGSAHDTRPVEREPTDRPHCTVGAASAATCWRSRRGWSRSHSAITRIAPSGRRPLVLWGV